MKNIFKKDFPFFEKNDIVFLDNAATSLKPKVVIEAINSYYYNFSTNTHSTDYSLAFKTNEICQEARKTIAQFINCENENEIVFSSGATASFNQIAYSLEKFLEDGDEIVTTKTEHGSLLLPFFRIKEKKNIVIKYIEVNENGLITASNLKKTITSKTKIVFFSNMNNSLGSLNNTEELTKIIKNYKIKKSEKWIFNEIIVIVDAAQAAAHIKTDVVKWNIDFFSLSGHKIFGPTGISFWWSKTKWLKLLEPMLLGGGMNSRIYNDGTFKLTKIPHRFEAGTQNIAGIFGLKAAIEYIMKIGFTKIYNHEKELKEYAIKQLKSNFKNKIIIYNQEFEVGTLLFNIKNVAAEEVSSFLGDHNIAVRSGNFCSKLINEVINCSSTIRISFLIYNDKKDVDRLIEAIKLGFEQGGDFLNGLF